MWLPKAASASADDNLDGAPWDEWAGWDDEVSGRRDAAVSID